MKTSFEEIEKNKVLLKVEVPSAEVDEAIGQACKEISKKIRVPGFRPGKIPAKVVKSRVGMETIYSEVLQSIMPVYYQKAVAETGIEPVAQPDVDIVQIEEGKPLRFNAKVEVKPEVKLGECKAVEVAKERIEIKDDWIDAQVQALRDRFAQLEPVERVIKKGDFALINFDGTIDEKAFEGGSAEDYLLEIGSKTLVGNFEEQLEGSRKGDIKDIWIEFPKEYGNVNLAGKKAKFKVLIKEVKQKILPDLNDDFAKEVSEFDTLEELRQDFKDKLLKAREKQVDFKLRMDVLNKVVENAELEIPETMIKNRKEVRLAEFKDTLQKQGLTLDDYYKAANKDKDKFDQEAEKESIEELNKELVLEAVSKAEKLEITNEETDNEIRKIAESMNKNSDEAIQAAKQQGTYEFFRGNLRTRKAWNWLVDHASISEEPAASKSRVGKEEEKKAEEAEAETTVEKSEETSE